MKVRKKMKTKTKRKQGILVTNDDGVYSSGIFAAYESVKDLGRATIVAPAMQKSAVGRSLSVFDPIRVNKIRVNGIEAYSVGGTPTDAIILGIYAILDKKPHLVLSGFNIGENLSTESVTTSGTVCAALEAASHGIPAIAASVQILEEKYKFEENGFTGNFEMPKKVINRIAAKLLRHGLPENVDLLNINFPASVGEDTEIEITHLAKKVYRTKAEKRQDPRGRTYYWIDGELIREAEEGSDVHAVLKKGNISITPLTLDSTAKIDLKQIEDLI